MSRVFINYRGEDSHSYGSLLYIELARRFGAENVFLDAESIPAGTDFVLELLGRVRFGWGGVGGDRVALADGRGPVRQVQARRPG